MIKSTKKNIPYGRQSISDDDIKAVVDVLKSDFLTTGPIVNKFEEAFCSFTGAKKAVAVSNGTAALHAIMYAINIQPEDEVILPSMTFAATSNAVIYQGGTPVFADIISDTLLIDPEQVKKRITPKTKAVIAVDYAGQPCDYDKLREICDKHKLYLISDACHSPGSQYKKRKTGTIADLTAFSFHPVKHITTGEGGMITTDNKKFSDKIKIFRNHGINSDHKQRSEKGTWYYEMQDLGYNYRITDFQCALGISQLAKLTYWIEKRNSIANKYSEAFFNINNVTPLKTANNIQHAYHLYVIKLKNKESRNILYNTMRKNNIGVNVHYIPVHLQPYYQKKFNTSWGMLPNTEDAYNRILSLPIYPDIKEEDIKRVIKCITDFA